MLDDEITKVAEEIKTLLESSISEEERDTYLRFHQYLLSGRPEIKPTLSSMLKYVEKTLGKGGL